MKWLRTKLRLDKAPWTNGQEWLSYLVGIRDDGATFIAVRVVSSWEPMCVGMIMDEKNVREKVKLILRECLDTFLDEPFNKRRVPVDAYKGNKEWVEEAINDSQECGA